MWVNVLIFFYKLQLNFSGVQLFKITLSVFPDMRSRHNHLNTLMSLGITWVLSTSLGRRELAGILGSLGVASPVGELLQIDSIIVLIRKANHMLHVE